MSLIHSSRVPDALRSKLDETDCFKAIVANQSEGKFSERTWVVEFAREAQGAIEAWLFLPSDPGRDARVIEHIHLTVHPDKSETVVNMCFLHAGAERVVVTHHLHGAKSSN